SFPLFAEGLFPFGLGAGDRFAGGGTRIGRRSSVRCLLEETRQFAERNGQARSRPTRLADADRAVPDPAADGRHRESDSSGELVDADAISWELGIGIHGGTSQSIESAIISEFPSDRRESAHMRSPPGE